ncbi:hypothetical protein FBU30_005180 [Linnemannia zychae]|nr:hypothetical protein FBU30_005180 [Linnemannia zychae]
MPAPPIDTPPALIRKFLATESFAGPSFTTAFSHPASGSTSSPSNSPCPPSLITAPAVAAVSPVQFLAKSRVVVAEASSFIGQHSVSSSSSMSSLPCASATSSSTALSSDEKESASNLLTSSLLSYETTTTLLEQDEIEDQSSSIFTRWQQQRSPSPLGQSSISAEEASADNGKNSIVGEDRSVTPTPSGTADSLRTRPSFDTLSVERPGTPTSYSSPAQELFSRIMDQNNDHMNNNSRRHSMGSLVDIMANKARSYLSPRTNEEKSNSAVSNSSGRRMSSTLSAGGTTAIAARSQRNSICGPLAPLPPLPPTHQQTNPNPQVVRVSSIESFPRHPSSSSNLRIQSLRDLFRSSASSSTASGGSGANSAATTPSHSRTPTVDSTADVNSHGTNKNNSASGTRRNSLMDFFSSNSKPQPNTASDDDRSAIITSSSTSTVTRHRSETNGSVVSTSTTSSMAYAPSVSKKLGSRPPLSVIAPPLVVPQVKQSPKLTHASLLSLTSNDNDARSSTSSSSSTTSSSSDPLRRPKYQVLTTPSSSTNNTSSNSVDHGSTHGYKPSPLPSFTVVNEIWMDPTTHTFHQLPGVLLTPSLPFPLTLPILPTSSSNASLNSSSTSVTATATTTTLPPPPLSATTTTTSSATTTTTTTTTTQPAQSSQALLPTTEGIEWPWSNMNPNDRDKWPTAFHIAAQQGGILALPPTYSPGSELDEVSALSLSRTNSNMIDYGSSVMEPRYYFGTGGLGNEGRQGGYYGSGSGNESVPNSLAGSRMSAGGGSLYYYDETLGQTPYGNGFLQGPTIPQQYSLLYHQSPSGPGY